MKSWVFSRSVYWWARDLHLYAGLFAGSSILIFAISTILLNHRMFPSNPTDAEVQKTKFGRLEIPQSIDGVELARQILDQVCISGEIQ